MVGKQTMKSLWKFFRKLFNSSSDGIITVGSVPEEYFYIQRQSCYCGGNFKIASQKLLEKGDKRYDLLMVKCKDCGEAREFIFNVKSFLSREEIYS